MFVSFTKLDQISFSVTEMLNLLFVKFLLIFRYRYLVLFGCVEFSLAVMLIYYSVYGWVILLFYEDDAISFPSSHHHMSSRRVSWKKWEILFVFLLLPSFDLSKCRRKPDPLCVGSGSFLKKHFVLFSPPNFFMCSSYFFFWPNAYSVLQC